MGYLSELFGGKRICAVCGKVFYADWEYAYKRTDKMNTNHMLWFCRYNHLLEWEAQHEIQLQESRASRPCRRPGCRVPPEVLTQMLELRRHGQTMQQIAQETGYSKKTVCKYLGTPRPD